MQQGLCLLVSGGCIFLPPERRTGVLGVLHEVPDAISVLSELKKHFFEHIYILCSTFFQRSLARESLEHLRCFKHHEGDLGILEDDQIVFTDGTSPHLIDVVCRIGVTHLISEDLKELRECYETACHLYHLSSVPADDAEITHMCSWECFRKKLLSG